MRAAECRDYGGPEQVVICRRPIPRPAAGQILVRVLASTVSTADTRIRSMTMPRGMGMIGRLVLGLRGPRRPVLGVELCGEIAALGAGVTGWEPGQRVVATTGARAGAHAEFILLSATGAVIAQPPALTVPEAAAMGFGGTTALVYLRDKARLRPGERVLVLGAGGTVGSAAVQIARAMGAQVTAQARSSRHAALRALGAVDVIDRRTMDFTAAGRHWDVILDAVGATTPRAALPCLTPTGRLLLVAADLPQMLMALANPLRRNRILSGPVADRAGDLAAVADLAQAGRFRPVIDSQYPLDRIAEAHARVDSGDKHGSVVIGIGL